MGLFDKFKGRKEPESQGPTVPQGAWDNAFKANVNFYGKEGEEPFGAVVLTEGVETILPVAPWVGRQASEGLEAGTCEHHRAGDPGYAGLPQGYGSAEALSPGGEG